VGDIAAASFATEKMAEDYAAIMTLVLLSKEYAVVRWGFRASSSTAETWLLRGSESDFMELLVALAPAAFSSILENDASASE
jgi:hypothetical protein